MRSRGMMSSTDYRLLLHPRALGKAEEYLLTLRAGATPGGYLYAALAGTDIHGLSITRFIDCLLDTKLPQIFAESSVCGDGSDWNLTELSILGDISVAVPVTAFDNGRHQGPEVHEDPFPATLLYTPGALLRNGRHCMPADWEEVVRDGSIDQEAYNALYERRLLPPLMYASNVAKAGGRKAFVTLPGLGCGQFAGPFHGTLGAHLETAISELLHKHHHTLDGIRAIYFDPYSECENTRSEIGAISFMVRPLTKGNETRPQLCHPTSYEESGDDFSMCDLFSIVAWDHVSWPGNDFYIGSRATDDGVKAAATDSMRAITGIRGVYNELAHEYQPPAEYRNWEDVVERNDIYLSTGRGLAILPGED